MTEQERVLNQNINICKEQNWNYMLLQRSVHEGLWDWTMSKYCFNLTEAQEEAKRFNDCNTGSVFMVVEIRFPSSNVQVVESSQRIITI